MTALDAARVQASTGTRPVADAHAFDQQALANWMASHVEGYRGPLEVSQFRGGQSNPTFRLCAGGRTYVMRRKPPGTLLPSAHAIDREFRLMHALRDSAVPVPRVHGLCADAGVIGSMFYVMEFVEGRILWDPALPGMQPAERTAIFGEMNRVLAALHAIEPVAVGLADYGRPGHYLERQVARWTAQYRAAETAPIAAADALIEWLPARIPKADESRIVHGDYRLDNVVFHPTEPRIVAVLDWELSTLGHPLVDFAYHCLTWHLAADQGRGLAGLDLASLGIPTEAEHLGSYLQRTGRAPHAVPAAEWGYYLVFNLFRLVGILQGVTARALRGNASSADAAEAARRTRPLAEQAWRMARQIERLG